MEEKPKEEEEDEKTLRLKEMKAFIEQVKERKAKLQVELKSKNINVDEENIDNKSPTEIMSTPDKG